MGNRALGVWIWARSRGFWTHSRVFCAQRRVQVRVVGEKPPDLSFASLQLGGVLQSSDKLKLRPISRQFLLIIFDTFFSSLSLETFNDGVRQQHDD